MDGIKKVLLEFFPGSNPNYIDRACTALSTLPIAGEGKELDGWQLVPVEPTVAMRMPWKTMRGDAWYDKYKAMLDAAPDVGKVHGEHLKSLQSLKILPFSGNALIQIIEGVKGSMEHGTWRDDKGMRLKDTNEWAVFYTTFKAATATYPQDRQNPSALDALQAIANLPTGKSEDEMNGQESAYRAVEALFVSPPHIVAAVPTDDTSSDMTRRLAAHCQSLIDIIDDVQVRCDEPVDDEDMDMVRYIGDDAASALISSPGKDGGQEVGAAEWQGRYWIEDEGRWSNWITNPVGYPWAYDLQEGKSEIRYLYPQPASTALVERLEALERGVRATSDSAYIASLNKFSSTPCLGWEAKIVSGKFGKDEMEAHAEANKLMGKHQGLAEALNLIRSALSASSREGESRG